MCWVLFVVVCCLNVCDVSFMSYAMIALLCDLVCISFLLGGGTFVCVVCVCVCFVRAALVLLSVFLLLRALCVGM